MRGIWLGVGLTVAVLLPTVGSAQDSPFRTPAPDVTAASAPWQTNGDPIVVGGLTYYPTRGFRLFDGQVMAQTGFFEGVPVYSDVTIAPFSELYVPLSAGRMRVYERRSERQRAGTTGAIGTAGTSVPRATADTPVRSVRPQPRRTTIMTTAQPAGADGVWLEFDGARWYSQGPAESFSPDRFLPIGEYHGFPVYRDAASASDEIWVSVVKDGPLAPYRKR